MNHSDGREFSCGGKANEVSGLKPLGFKEERSDNASYVTPHPYRGKRNEPAYVVEIVKKLAEIKNLEVEEMRDVIAENAKRIFKI